MTLLNAFMDTWSQARKAFGAGTPSQGAQFDQSAALRGLQSQVQGAAPGELWRGTAADAYAAVNADHAAALGAVADLDVRLAVEVDRSASVVAAGRDDLETVRDWVVAAASSVPASRSGDVVVMSIVSSGLAQVSQIVARANSELNGIGASIQKLGAVYSALGNQKFGVRGPVPEQPGGVDDVPPPAMDEVAAWYVDWNELNRDVVAHNAAVAAHLRARPPSTDAAAIFAWNARGAELNARAQAIYDKQLHLAAEAVLLGIPEPPLTPPQQFGDPSQVPRGAVPSNLMAPRSSVTAKVFPT